MTTEYAPGQKISAVYCTSVYKPNIGEWRTRCSNYGMGGIDMWFRLKATSCSYDINAYKNYCKELSTFNVRILNVPQSHYPGVLDMYESILVELNTLEDFIRLRDSLGESLILREDYDKLIEIYDDWRE